MISAIRGFAFQYPLIFHLMIVTIALVLLAKASFFLVYGISNYAKKLGISDYIVGVLIVALGASVPELFASVSGILSKAPSVAFGTVFGSNMVGITLIIGILAIYGKKVPTKEKVFEKTKYDVFLLIALPFILLLDGKLGSVDGVVLIGAFLLYLVLLWKREGQFGTIKKKIKFKDIYKDGLIFILSLVTILVASRLLVDSSLELSSIMNFHPFMVAVVLIGFGSQVPDLFLGLSSIKKGHNGVALGDIFGSMIIKSLLFLGIFTYLTTLRFNMVSTIITAVLTLGSLLLLFAFIKKGYLTRTNGYYLVIFYFIFIITQYMIFTYI